MKRLIGYEIKCLDNIIERKIILLYKNSNKQVITPIQGKIIDLILKNKEIYQRDLEKEFNLRRSTISGILKTMEKNNLIIKTKTHSDYRKRLIIPTDKIKKEISMIKKEMEFFEENISKNISDDELNTFFNVIDKIKYNIEN